MSSLGSAVLAAAPEPLARAFRTWRNQRVFRGAPYPERFRICYERNLWRSSESRSGPGSTEAFTRCLRPRLEHWLAQHRIGSLVDAACGDFNWMRLVKFPARMRYHGLDIVPAIVAENAARYATETVSFAEGDVLKPGLPKADVYLCRDLFIHFPNAAVDQAIANMRASGSRFLVASTFPSVTTNRDTLFADCRLHNLALHLGEPIELLPDGAPGKFIGVWRLN